MQSPWRFLAIIPACFTLMVAWLSWNTYRFAPGIAAENLRGAALSSAAVIEQLVRLDSGLKTLPRYNNPDIAYLSLIDKNGTIRFHTNPALVGKPSLENSPVGQKNSILSEQRKTLGTGEEIYQLQTSVHTDNNDYILLLNMHTYRADAVIRRARAGLGMVLFLTISLWGMTAAILFLVFRAEKQQRHLQRREELARLGELGAVMAHEIRNPLSGIKGFAQLVDTAADMGQARHFAEKIVTQSIRMESLVNDLLSYSRENTEIRQKTDLGVITRDCVDMIRMDPNSKIIEIEHAEHAGIWIKAVSDRLIQLLLNLMKNGIQAMPDGGILRVKLETSTSSAIITITDTGIGIPQENIPRIFEPFWTSKTRGTGLGLAICRKIAEEHAGSLTVESTAGTGTAFTLSLPLEE